jgi:hypothetical protein
MTTITKSRGFVLAKKDFGHNLWVCPAYSEAVLQIPGNVCHNSQRMRATYIEHLEYFFSL